MGRGRGPIGPGRGGLLREGGSTVGVLGAGSFGTALAVHVSGLGLPTRLWARRQTTAEELARSRRNERYLDGVDLPMDLEITADLESLSQCNPVIVAVPSHGFRDIVRQFFARIPAGESRILVSATKGIEI
ncbi:MAG: NAD(P)-binding domain-containing protein, partial [Acidobacteria bacterium]|nr:NAD(P)-binding domain-containing protein [Acidobacteriota bacterium]